MKKIRKSVTFIMILSMVLQLLPVGKVSANDGVTANQSAFVIASAAINATNFPDATFRTYVKNYDRDKNGILSETELAAVTSISVNNQNISSLQGIEWFVNLSSLECYNNQLVSLDLSNNPELSFLHCAYNQLTSLDLSNNPKLGSLYCSDNQLTSLNVSNNPELFWLDCEFNQLTSLDVSNKPELETLKCTVNKLVSLVASNNSSLKTLKCERNQLVSLDVSDNPSLEYLYCGDNQLASLDVSNKPKLKGLYCFSNKLASLDVSGNPALSGLECYNNQLASLDVSNNPILVVLSCFNNKLASLDVSNNPALKTLYCYKNQLASLNVSSNPELVTLKCDSNKLASLDVSNNLKLVILYCDSNQLKSLDVRKNSALKQLVCYSNQIASLDVSNNPALEELNCNSNKLRSLDVNNNPLINYLRCDSNQLASLDVSSNPALETLYCDKNQLKSLDVSNNSLLIWLLCSNNQLKSLDVSNNPLIKTLYCSYNQLPYLDISSNPAISDINCYGNEYEMICDSMDTSGIIGFDIEKASNWTNAQVNGTTVTAINSKKSITYTYRIGVREWTFSWYLVSPSSVKINTANFPDANFRAYVKKEFDPDNYGILTKEDLNAVTKINVDNCNIGNLKGIEWFPNLKSLSCSNNNLKSLDVSGNTALISLKCNGNQLSYLDISKNSAITDIDCSDNKYPITDSSIDTSIITGFDISKASVWTNAQVSGTTVTAIDPREDITYTYQICDERTETFRFSLPQTDAPVITTFQVIFKDGTVIKSTQTVESGAAAAAPILSKPGYTLSWDKGFTNINKDTVVNAVWTANKYIVTFDQNGGNVKTKSKTITYASVYGTLPSPTKRNYTFAGWYTEKTGGTKITSVSTVSTIQAQTLYARWSNVTVKQAAIKKLTIPSTGKIKVAINKVSGAAGYEVRYADNSKFKNAKKAFPASSNVTLKNLKKGKTYYVKVRAYKKDSAGNLVYGKYSGVKRIRVTK